MHIAFIVSNFPNDKFKNVGGIETSVKNLAIEFIKLNHHVSVFVYGQDKDKECTRDGIKIYSIKNVKLKWVSWFLTRKKIQNKINSIHGIDVVEAPDWTGITAFMKLNCKCIIRIHGSDTLFCNLENTKPKYFNYFLEKSALKNADSIISVSEFASQKTKELFKISSKIAIIHNGINISLFKDLENTKLEGTILYFGTIIRKKGILELADIFNKVIEKCPSTKLTFLGRDILDKKEGISTLKLFRDKLSFKASKNFIYIDSVPYQEVKSYIQRASVVVFPSFAEAFPMSWLEAMSMEKVLVSSNIGWAKEVMIDNVTGYMVSPKKHTEYADKIVHLLQFPELAKKMGVKARKRIIDNFDISKIACTNLKMYSQIIKKL